MQDAPEGFEKNQIIDIEFEHSFVKKGMYKIDYNEKAMKTAWTAWKATFFQFCYYVFFFIRNQTSALVPNIL